MRLSILNIALLSLIVLTSCSKKEEEPIPEPVIKAEQRTYSESEQRYLAIGDSITNLVAEKLKAELMNAISEGGYENAIQFCNINALPFTSNVVDGTGMTIKRVSADYRNPLNKPDDLEDGVLFDYTYDVHVGEAPQPMLIKAEGKLHYFKPIIVQSFCLSCHGTPGKELSADLYAKIKGLYPEDLATRYKAGHLRGAFHLVFGDEGKKE
ncbi:MAG: DUF3365 domain-containing protein [Candidatus Kapabacteria bacterium]|nr:DUF3365 domain-containing protein [Candidatus Kapabacteria bacterium]